MAGIPFLPTPPYAPGPAVHGFAITPAPLGETIFTTPTRFLWVGVSGALEVVLTGDAAPVTLLAAPVGLLEISVVQVVSTGTTATNIIGLY
jgi:hypothetical protein